AELPQVVRPRRARRAGRAAELLEALVVELEQPRAGGLSRRLRDLDRASGGRLRHALADARLAQQPADLGAKLLVGQIGTPSIPPSSLMDSRIARLISS